MEVLGNIFDSDIMFYVVVPILIVLLGWIKGEIDVRKKIKNLGIGWQNVREYTN